jgi:lysosomal acid lipase/cholesteryl ester hydrolase
VILLQHGISQDAKAWVSQNNDSIAFLLWKSNYDIWLSNSRGTFYSQNHVSYKSSSEEFWNFTFHEKGYYDNKAVIEYIKTITKVSKIVYVGHSGGTTSSFVYASTRPEEAADSLKLIVALAPVTFLKYYKTPLIETLFRSVQFLMVKKKMQTPDGIIPTLFKNYTFRKITYTNSLEFTVSFTTTVCFSS